MALGKECSLSGEITDAISFFSNKQIQRVTFSRIVRVSEMAMIVNLPGGKKIKILAA